MSYKLDPGSSGAPFAPPAAKTLMLHGILQGDLPLNGFQWLAWEGIGKRLTKQEKQIAK